MGKQKTTDASTEPHEPAKPSTEGAGLDGRKSVRVGRTGLVGVVLKTITPKKGAALHLVRYKGPAEITVHGTPDPLRLRRENDQIDVWETASDCSEA